MKTKWLIKSHQSHTTHIPCTYSPKSFMVKKPPTNREAFGNIAQQSDSFGNNP